MLHYNILALVSVRGWVDMEATERLEALSQLKIQVTSLGIKTPTIRFVA
jgi:hypothetical protein